MHNYNLLVSLKWSAWPCFRAGYVYLICGRHLCSCTKLTWTDRKHVFKNVKFELFYVKRHEESRIIKWVTTWRRVIQGNHVYESSIVSVVMQVIPTNNQTFTLFERWSMRTGLGYFCLLMSWFIFPLLLPPFWGLR